MHIIECYLEVKRGPEMTVFKPQWLDSNAISVFVVILVEFDKYCSDSETSRLVLQ